MRPHKMTEDELYEAVLNGARRYGIKQTETEELIKKVKSAGENTKVVIRNARRDAIEALKKTQKEGLPEDMEKDFEQNVQKDTDSSVKKVDEIVSLKEKEILTV